MNEYDIAAAFQAIEEELIASMIRNMDRHRAEETKEGYEWSMWQAEQLKARVDANNRCLRSHGFPADYTMAHAIHFALEMYFRILERKESPEAATSRGLK